MTAQSNSQSDKALEKLKLQLDKIEKKLEANRTSTIQDGWQTQKFARKSRNWDYYAQEKFRLLQEIDAIEKGGSK